MQRTRLVCEANERSSPWAASMVLDLHRGDVDLVVVLVLAELHLGGRQLAQQQQGGRHQHRRAPQLLGLGALERQSVAYGRSDEPRARLSMPGTGSIDTILQCTTAVVHPDLRNGMLNNLYVY